MEQQELDLRDLLHIFRRRLLLIIALPVIAALTAALISLFVLSPVYQSSTSLWVMNQDGASQINYNDLLLNRNLTKTYAEVAKSRVVMADVIERLDLTGMTVEELQAKLTVTPVRDTEILSVSVEDTDPVVAARLATAVAESFKRQVVTHMKAENVVVMDPAVEPVQPIKPRKAMNTAIAFVLGLMAAVGIAFLLEYLDTTLKSPDDVTRHLNLPVLAVIPVLDIAQEIQPELEAGKRRRSVRREIAHEKR